MHFATLLFCILLFLKNHGSLADFPQNSSSVGEFQNAVDQCYGFCNQIKPILDHSDHFTQLWNRAESRLDALEDQLKKFQPVHFQLKPELEKFIKISSKYLYFEKVNKLNWFAAFVACREIGGQLVIVQNKKELNEINGLIAQNVTYWLGINDLAFEGVYRTWLSEEYAPFVRWTQGEPDNGTENQDCVALYESNMWDLECEKSRFFICEAAIED
ncbi:hypothetical protein KR074_005030 [Drosophila pseudoananassae]|nr:hypothetical protein KR074_005030 [Drosophila pseudoananassae]